MVFINSQSLSFQRGSPSCPCPLSTASLWPSSTDKVRPFKEGLPQVPVLSTVSHGLHQQSKLVLSKSLPQVPVLTLLLPMVIINSQSWSFQRGSPSCPCPLSTAHHDLHQQSKLVLSKRASLKSQSSLYCFPWSSSTDKVGLPHVPVLSLLLPMVFINSQSWSFQRGSPSSPCPLSTASHGLHQQSKFVLSKRVSLMSLSSLYCLPMVFINRQSWSFQRGSPSSPSPLSTAPHGLHQQTK